MADEHRESRSPDATSDAESAQSPQDVLYRQRAYEQLGRAAPIDGVLRVSTPHEWLILLVLAATVIAALAWSVVGRLESGVSGPCVLRAAGSLHSVAAPATGAVVVVLAEPGDELTVGDPLARLTAPELSRAAGLAAARATALADQYPGTAEAVAAVAEAEHLAAMETASTLVLSPVSGLLATSGLRAGVFVEAGATVAEVQRADTRPPTAVVSLGSEAARVSPGLTASIALTVADAADPLVADARITAVGASPSGPASLGTFDRRPAAGTASTAPSEAAAELTAPPPEFAVAAMPGAVYECTARIVTGSYRPIERLVGRR